MSRIGQRKTQPKAVSRLSYRSLKDLLDSFRMEEAAVGRKGSDPAVRLEPNAVAYSGSVMVLEEAARVPAHLELLRPQLYLRTDYLHHGRHLVEAVEQERETGRQHETDFHHGSPTRDAAAQPLHHIYVIVRAISEVGRDAIARTWPLFVAVAAPARRSFDGRVPFRAFEP